MSINANIISYLQKGETMNTTELKVLSQDQAYQTILEKLENIVAADMLWDNVVSLSGPAGTGKTYLTTMLVKKLSEKYSIIMTAPTHKALQVLRTNLHLEQLTNIQARTLQSFLNIRLNRDYNNGTQKFQPLQSKSADDSKTDILIIDESSMVSEELYEFVSRAIETYRAKAVLFVGDEYQLLPVDNKNNKIFDITSQYKLNKIVRQAQGSYIITMASKARAIIKSKKYISIKEFLDDSSFNQEIQYFQSEQDFYDDFCTPQTWAKKDKVIASFTNNSVDKHNRVIRNRYWSDNGVSHPEVLLAGDKVIFQEANTIRDRIVHQNSDIVTLSSAKKSFHKSLDIYYWDCLDLDHKPFKVVDPSSKERLETVLNKIAKSAKFEKNKEERNKKWATFFAVKELFVDVKYTYASTIHKLQGSTYETVYIDLRDLEGIKDKDLMYRLLYVAITRASTNIKVLLSSGIDSSLVQYQENILSSLDDQFAKLGLEL